MALKKLKRPCVAFLLSLFFPGTGQLYNRQGRKALYVAFLVAALPHVLFLLRLAHTFKGLIVLVVLQLIVLLFVIIDAVRSSANDETIAVRPPLTRSVFATALLIVAINVAWSLSNLGIRELGVRAYVDKSESMAPTLVLGDRFVADSRVYSRSMPQRGDVVTLAQEDPNSALWTKRVVGLPGDTLEIRGGVVYLKGRSLPETYRMEPPNPADNYGPTKIPPSHYFVLGDNRENSYDSRFFGPIDGNRLRGRVLYVYWSPNHNRTGHQVR